MIIRHILAQIYGWIANVLGTLTPKHVHLLPATFSSSTWKRGGVWMCKLGVISQERLKIEVKLSANRKSQQRMTSSDHEWPFHASRAISAVAVLIVL